MTTTTAAPVPERVARGTFRRTVQQPGPRRGRRPWLLATAGAVVALVFLAPYLVMLVGSFKSRAEILGVPPTYLPRQWHPGNYLSMWSTPETPLPYNMVSTLVISFSATALVLVVALPAAYYTARFRFPGRLAFLLLVLMTHASYVSGKYAKAWELSRNVGSKDQG